MIWYKSDEKLKEFVNSRTNDGVFVKTIIMGALLILFLTPYILVSFYANPSGDDFAFMANTINQPADSWVMKSLMQAKTLYLSWQGTFFTNVTNCLFSAMLHFGGLFGLHIELVLGIVIFVISLLFLTSSYLKIFVVKMQENVLWIALLSILVLLFCVLYNFNVADVFYWHTGLYAYTIPFSIALVAVGFALRSDGSKARTVIAAIAAFFSAGGSLNIAAFINVICFYLFLYYFFEKKQYRNVLSIFVFALVGALINVLAPGNYTRHSAITDEYNIIQTVMNSATGVLNRNIEMLFGITAPFVIIFVIVTYNYIGETDTKFINPFIGFVGLLCGEIIIDFPVNLGYANERFPERCEFISRVSMMLLLFAWLINCIGWFAKKRATKIQFNKQFVVVLICLCFSACLPFASNDVQNYFFPFIMINDLTSGELKRYENANNIIILALENAKDEDDLVLEIYDWADIEYLRGMRLSSDPDYWVNHETTSYYTNVKSISVDYK